MIPGNFRPLQMTRALNMMSNSRTANLSAEEIRELCAKLTCSKCTKAFKLESSREFHEKECTQVIPDVLKRRSIKVRERKEDILSDDDHDGSDSNSDLSEAEKTLRKEVVDTDPEMSTEDEEDPEDIEHSICTFCLQGLKDIQLYKSTDAPSNEAEVLKEFLIEEEDTVSLQNYVMFDGRNHLVDFTKGFYGRGKTEALISKGKELYFSGKLVHLGKEEDIHRFGPVTSCFDYQQDGDSKSYYFLVVNKVNYALQGNPHNDYFPFMFYPLLRLELIDRTNEYMRDESKEDNYEKYLKYLEECNEDLCEVLFQETDLSKNITNEKRRVFHRIQNLSKTGRNSSGKQKKRKQTNFPHGRSRQQELRKHCRSLKSEKSDTGSEDEHFVKVCSSPEPGPSKRKMILNQKLVKSQKNASSKERKPLDIRKSVKLLDSSSSDEIVVLSTDSSDEITFTYEKKTVKCEKL